MWWVTNTLVTYIRGSISNRPEARFARVGGNGEPARDEEGPDPARAREAAVELFIAKGYDATTVAEIAAAAEVSEPTFFRYYPTKAAVVLAPLEHRIDLTLTALETLPGELPRSRRA